MEYHTKLLTLPAAAHACRILRSEFWRFLLKHIVPTLSNQMVHEDDIIKAIDAERQGAIRK